MNDARKTVAFFAVLLLAAISSFSAAQSTANPPAAVPVAGAPSPHSVLVAKFERPFSSSKLKAGDSLTARTAKPATLPDGTSLFDRFGTGFTLVTHVDAADSAYAADAAGVAADAAADGIPVTALPIAGAVLRERYPRRFTLVRPDGHVAWRGERAADAREALLRVTGRYGTAAARAGVPERAAP